ncbi:hypothetical protein [Streptomyces aureoversilis]|uniref:HD domain-containing protein n=1 Tax=Streptomyces aureoversilis TaxID=67277 RepID=A0ABW0A8H5_9ACTN
MTKPALLKDLADRRALPAHQQMDPGTVEWIAEHRPATFPAMPPRPRYEPLMLAPDASWFASVEQSDSLHGVRHGARVSLLASVLAHEQGLDGNEAAALCVAAAVHDCRRRDDRTDAGHGQRAARWFAGHAVSVTACFGLRLSADCLLQATTAIALHDVPYEHFTLAQVRAYRRAQQVTDLLKAADCLDRYRLPALRWWPDTARLRTPVPDWLHPLAFDLVVRSERARLDGAGHEAALAQACSMIFPAEPEVRDAKPLG